MSELHCASCDAPIATGSQCASCAGNASTLIASKAVQKASTSLIGVEVIGQYVIRSRLGKGAMGAVYLADQQSVGRRAVIKVLHPHLSKDAEIKTRFETEARAASQLNHPNIVTIYNYGAMTDGTLFLAMEHLDGQTLAQLTAKRRLPLERAVDIVCQIADALGEAHRRGVVHRDVKPTNVMVVERGERSDFVKVLDFGIAQIEGARMTATGDICGTPTYMSPEQIRSKPVDGRSDLYALGCVLFELVTGEVPFDGDNSIALAYKHVHEDPPRASAVAPKAKLPAALDAFLARTLAKDPSSRPPDAAAFRDELRAAIADPAAVPATSPVPKSAPKADSKPTKLARDDRTSRRMRRPLFRRVAAAMRDTGLSFRRRKTFGERMATRLRAFAPGFTARSRRKRWMSIAIAAICVSLLGVGAYFAFRTDAKPGASPTSTPAKSTRPKRSAH